MTSALVRSFETLCARCQHNFASSASRSRLYSTTSVRPAARPPKDSSSLRPSDSPSVDTSIATSTPSPTQKSSSSTETTTSFSPAATSLPSSSPPSGTSTPLDELSRTILNSGPNNITTSTPPDSFRALSPSRDSRTSPRPPPHRLHVYAHRHNTHITLSRPSASSKPVPNLSPGATVYESLINVSAGNIGFKKAARGSYDAGYQLGAYVMNLIKDKGYLKDMAEMEIVMRDFGKGRDAITKILCGQEGRLVRGRVIRVMDNTRLKFGGTKGANARRLG